MHKLNKSFIEGFEKQAGMSSLLGHKAAKGFVENGMRQGMNSMISWPAEAAAKKMLGRKKATKLFYDINEAILDADTVAGHHAHNLVKKIPFMENLFLAKEKIQHGGLQRHFDKYTGKGVKYYHDATRPSVLAPLDKASRIATPIISYLAVDNYLKKKREAKQREELVQTSGQ